MTDGIAVTRVPTTVAVVQVPTIVRVTSPGPQGRQGEQGSAGPPGGGFFVFTQTDPAATWIIDHDLGRKVHVTIFDLTETVVFADIHHGSINQTSIEFAGPVAGSAVLS